MNYNFRRSFFNFPTYSKNMFKNKNIFNIINSNTNKNKSLITFTNKFFFESVICSTISKININYNNNSVNGLALPFDEIEKKSEESIFNILSLLGNILFF
jgi:hypothetical protein